MPMLSDIAKLTGGYLESTQAGYNQARKDAERAALMRAVEEDLLGAQKYLNPDVQQQTASQEGADILSQYGPMFSAPQASGAIGYAGKAAPAAAPMFSIQTPAPDVAQYDGTVRPAPVPAPPAPLLSGVGAINKIMQPLQDSLPPVSFSRQQDLAGTNAAGTVKGMVDGNTQGASAGGSFRISGIGDETARKIQEDYNARSKELSSLDRQDALDRARLAIMKRKSIDYMRRTNGLGGPDEWQAEIEKLEGSISKREESRNKILTKLQDTDQKLLASRSRAEAQNASLQIKKEAVDNMKNARIQAMRQKNANDALKIFIDNLHFNATMAWRKFNTIEANRGQNMVANMADNSFQRKQYQAEALGAAVDQAINHATSLGVAAFARSPEEFDKVADQALKIFESGLPVFDPPGITPESQSTYQKVLSQVMGTEVQAPVSPLAGSAASFSDWRKRAGNPSITVPTQGYTLGMGGGEGGGVSLAFPMAATQVAPVAAPKAPKRAGKTKKKLDF